MVPDWGTDCVYFSKHLPERHPDICEQLRAALSGSRIPVRFLNGTRDIWARDYCPVQIRPGRFVKFRYDPDYLRGSYEHLITRDNVCKQLCSLGAIERSRIILDGGNLVTSGHRAILTDKVFRENPHQNRKWLQSRLCRLLEVEKCLVIPKEPYDMIGHADGMVRFLAEDLVVTNDYSRVDPAFGERLRAVLTGHGLQVETLPYFYEHVQTNGIPSAVGNYVNFLRVGDSILMPAYDVPQDEEAARKLESLCPRNRLVPIRCALLAREGGVLNCVAWTLRRDSTTAG